MQGLDNRQIILLVLLVSFVTSLATGIVTVSLLEQAPAPVTQTINRVVEKTVQTVVPQETKIVEVVKEVPAESTESKNARLVGQAVPALITLIEPQADGSEKERVGFFVSGEGYAVTTGVGLVPENTYKIVHVGEIYTGKVLSISSDSSAALLEVRDTNWDKPKDPFSRIAVSETAPVLAQSVIALGRYSGSPYVRSGLVSAIDNGKVGFNIDIPFQAGLAGGPVISGSGALLGMTGRDLGGGSWVISAAQLVSLIKSTLGDQAASVRSAL